jgi:signal transduction histidine kinase
LSSNLTGSLSPNDPDLAPITRSMVAVRQQVIDAWIANVRAAIPNAALLGAPILENTLPGFFDSLADLLTDHHALRVRTDLGVLATEHGGERARLTPYDSIAVIHELQIFRDTLFAELDKHGVRLGTEQHQLINGCVDGAIRESVNSFVAVQSALREQFIAAITHDLRTPLSNAQVAAQLIERSAGDENVRQLARKIQENTHRIDSMTRDLLNRIVFSGDAKLKLQITFFDIAELVREVAQYAQNLHSIELDLDVQPVTGHWCRESLRRAIENLVSNAIKYGAPDEPIRLEVNCTDSRAKVAVHNMGTPIPAEDLETIFQLYRRAPGADERTEGWGVGLPFARKVAEAHGGSIMVSSTIDAGTSFVIDVPRDARQFENAPSAA